jgi:hypothetical protein
VEKLFMGWEFRVLEFCFFFFFCQVWLQQESILFDLLKVSQARLELAASGLVGRQVVAGVLAGSGLAGRWAGGQVAVVWVWWWRGCGGPSVLSVYFGMEKTSMG